MIRMNRSILLHARRGLGNRLRAVLSAQAYADATGRRLRVLWLENEQCGATWKDLFEDHLDMVGVTTARFLAATSGGWLAHLEADDFDLGPYAARRMISMHASQPFSNPTGDMWWSRLSRLTPVADVRHRVATLWDELPVDAPRIGVMIRSHASAHTATTQTNPVRHASDRISALNTAFPSAAFVVSCDSPEVAEDLQRRFDNVSVLADKGPFNSRRGVQDALCDLYLVAACNWIITSRFSSLSELAALVAGHDGIDPSSQDSSLDPALATVALRLATPIRHPSDLWAQP